MIIEGIGYIEFCADFSGLASLDTTKVKGCVKKIIEKIDSNEFIESMQAENMWQGLYESQIDLKAEGKGELRLYINRSYIYFFISWPPDNRPQDASGRSSTVLKR